MSQQYDDYLASHIANVAKGYLWLSENMPDLLTKTGVSLPENIACSHDESKRSKEEYDAYDAFFYGGNRSFAVKKAFDKAWLHHIHNNPHHWQHWILFEDDPSTGATNGRALEMPYDYIIEMICDWWAFSWKKGDLYEIFKWYTEHEPTMKLHRATKAKVEEILCSLENKLLEMGLIRPGKEENHGSET